MKRRGPLDESQPQRFLDRSKPMKREEAGMPPMDRSKPMQKAEAGMPPMRFARGGVVGRDLTKTRPGKTTKVKI